MKQLELSGGQENVTDYETTIKQDNSNFIDFEKTGTEKHWKDMSQWERLQAKVKARGRPQEEAKLKMQQSTFGITQWNQPPSRDPIEKPKTEVKDNTTTNVGSEIKNDGSGVIKQVTKQIPGSSFFPDPEQYV